MRGDLQWDPAFFSAKNVTFSGGLRAAKREIDYEFGRYLADQHGNSNLDGIDYGANWTNFGYFQDGAIGAKACDSLGGGGAPMGTPGRPSCAVDSRFSTAPALILPYQTMAGSPGRVERINGFWSSGNAGTNSVLVQNRSQMSNALGVDPVAVSGYAIRILPVAVGNIQRRGRNHFGLPDGGCRSA